MHQSHTLDAWEDETRDSFTLWRPGGGSIELLVPLKELRDKPPASPNVRQLHTLEAWEGQMCDSCTL